MNYKNNSKKVLAILVALAILSPAFSFAAIGDQSTTKAENRAAIQAERAATKEANKTQKEANKEENQAQKTEKTCTQISAQADQIQAKLTEMLSTLTQKRTDMDAKMKQQIETKLSELNQKRATIDSEKTINWEKLRANAKTDEQKAAVEKFILAVQGAIQAKRTATDNVISSFRASLLTERTDRKTENDAALTTYKNAITSLVSQAKTDCTTGDAKTIRENFRTGIKSARDTFQASRKTTEKFQAEVTPIKEAKKDELQTIINTFKSSIEAAKSELRLAFPKTTETTTVE
jgi:hypothetical protein